MSTKWGEDLGRHRDSKDRVSDWFRDFSSQTSFHGWRFIGERGGGAFQRTFWSLVIFASLIGVTYLSREAILEFTNSTIKISTEDRSAPLDDAFFPSVVVCNINPLRKSFIYWLQEGLKSEGIDKATWQLFDLIGHIYFKTSNEDITAEDNELLKFIFDSDFYSAGFEEFYAEKLKKETKDISKSKVFLYSDLMEISPDPLPPYQNSTR